MARICIGFFGFIRNSINYEIFNQFKQLLPANSILDIFITCPNKVNEYDDPLSIIDMHSEIIKDIRAAFGTCNVYVDIYEYDPLIFIKKVRNLRLPDYTSYPIYRVFSGHFSISRLCRNITNFARDNHINYKNIILTRFDIIPGVKSLGNLLEHVDENNIHIWRRCPYSSDTDAEDRIIISSMKGVHALADLYENGNTRGIDIYETLVPENILGKYLTTFPNLIKLPQDGIKMELSPSIKVKYSGNTRDYMNSMLKKYEEISIT
jgi:hypothetical protein